MLKIATNVIYAGKGREVSLEMKCNVATSTRENPPLLGWQRICHVCCMRGTIQYDLLEVGTRMARYFPSVHDGKEFHDAQHQYR